MIISRRIVSSFSSVALLSLAASALPSSAEAQIQGFDVNFNGSSATYTGNFSRFNGAAPVGFTWGANVGTGGSGGLEVTNVNGANNLYYRPTPGSDSTSTFDFASMAVGTSIYSTTDFAWSSITATTTTLLTAGFVPNFTLDNALTSAGALAGSIIRNSAVANEVTLRMRNGTDNASALTFNQSTLTAGNWYQLGFQLTKSATANTFDYVVSLFSLGADGLSAPVLFNDGTKDLTISGSLTNSSIYADANAYFAYDIRNASGINYVDNFHVATVPEPMTVSMIAAGLLGLAAVRRLRGKRETVS